jgi:enoyl-CoA hydratase/carnithine racemase
VATVLLARPGARNAVSTGMLEELVGALGDLATEPGIRVVVLGGDGPDFCAGADFAELAGARSGPSGIDYGRAFEDALAAVETHPAPVIASVHGAALGAGCQLVVACDLAVAAEDARLGIPAARLGVLITFENIQRLVLGVGPKRAGEILYTGRTLTGVEAADWGLVNQAVPADRLGARVADLAEEVADAAPLSVRGSKRGVRVVLERLSVDRFTEGHRVADFDMMAAAAFASEDLQEGIRAFRERRKPEFRGR